MPAKMLINVTGRCEKREAAGWYACAISGARSVFEAPDPASDHIRDGPRRWPTPKYATSADTTDRANLAQGAVRLLRLAVRCEIRWVSRGVLCRERALQLGLSARECLHPVRCAVRPGCLGPLSRRRVRTWRRRGD